MFKRERERIDNETEFVNNYCHITNDNVLYLNYLQYTLHLITSVETQSADDRLIKGVTTDIHIIIITR